MRKSDSELSPAPSFEAADEGSSSMYPEDGRSREAPLAESDANHNLQQGSEMVHGIEQPATSCEWAGNPQAGRRQALTCVGPDELLEIESEGDAHDLNRSAASSSEYHRQSKEQQHGPSNSKVSHLTQSRNDTSESSDVQNDVSAGTLDAQWHRRRASASSSSILPGSSASAVSCHSDDGTIAMWQRAVKRDAERRFSGGPDSAGHSGPSVGPNGAVKASTTYLSPGEWMRGKRRSASASFTSGGTTIRLVSQSDTLLPTTTGAVGGEQDPSPERPSNPRGQEALANVAACSGRRTPPESWAKWPSFNREARTGSAGPSDQVKCVDFAVCDASSTDQIRWCTDKDMVGPDGHRGRPPTGLSQAVKTSIKRLSRFVPGLATDNNKDNNASVKGRRRSSVRRAGQLEYPELELLPTEGGFRELRALESEIELVRGGPVREDLGQGALGRMWREGAEQ